MAIIRNQGNCTANKQAHHKQDSSAIFYQYSTACMLGSQDLLQGALIIIGSFHVISPSSVNTLMAGLRIYRTWKSAYVKSVTNYDVLLIFVLYACHIL